MSNQITICMTGSILATIRQLLAEYPGATANKIGRALVRVGLRHVQQHPDALAQELLLLQSRGASTHQDLFQHPSVQEDV